MTDFDVELDMTRATVIDEKIESLLSATADADDPVVAELASVMQSLAEAFQLPVIAEDVEDAHIARMMAAVVPGAAFVVPEVATDRTSPLATLKASFGRRTAAATLAFSTAFTGAAYAGVLPDPVQGAVARAASFVGLILPGAEDDAATDDDLRDDARDIRNGDGGGETGTGGDPEDEGGENPEVTGDEADDRRDAREDAEDEAEDRREDEADRREDEADDARDALEDAEDEAEDADEDRRDEAEDRNDDEADEREDDEDDAADALEDAEDEAEDAADESREDIEVDSRGDGLDDDDDDGESLASDENESDD